MLIKRIINNNFPLIQAKNDLSSHFDTAVVSLADLNRNRSSANEQNQNENSINKQTIQPSAATSLQNQIFSETQTIGDPNMNESPKRGEFFFVLVLIFFLLNIAQTQQFNLDVLSKTR